jgi:peroxiredoxin
LTGAAARVEAKSKSLQVGDAAPDFAVTTFDLQTFKLAQLRGQVILLNYWATWCAPCRAEMLVMEAYMRTRRPKDLRIFAVATEDSVSPGKLRPLAKTLSFPLARRLRGKDYGTIGGAVPTSYVIDRAGVIRHAKAGAFTDASFDSLITPLLAEAPPAVPPASAPT